jgi:hypothetical protein
MMYITFYINVDNPYNMHAFVSQYACLCFLLLPVIESFQSYINSASVREES